jgi:hypothetical protein
LLIQSQIFFPLNSHKDPIDQKEEREGEEKKKKKAPFFFFCTNSFEKPFLSRSLISDNV